MRSDAWCGRFSVRRCPRYASSGCGLAGAATIRQSPRTATTLEGVLEATESAIQEQDHLEALADMEPVLALSDAQIRESQSLVSALSPMIRRIPTPALIQRALDAATSGDKASTFAYMNLLDQRASEIEGNPLHSRDWALIQNAPRDLSAGIKGITGQRDPARISRIRRARVEAIRSLNRIEARTSRPVTAGY
jgi:hypothetical protein